MERIFLSSTFTDLLPFRKKVLEGLDRLRHAGYDLEWFAMEGFNASPNASSREAILRYLSQCTTYLGVLGPRYGSLSAADGTSFVELEYETSKALEMPRLLFLMDVGCDAWREIGEDADEELRSKQQQLRTRFQADRLLNHFDSPGDLAMKVVVSLLPSLNAEVSELVDSILNELVPERAGAGPISAIALAASPAFVVANGTTSATITATVTDADGNNAPNGTMIAFLAVGNGSCNPRFAYSTDGVATTTLEIYRSAFDGKCFVECVAIKADVSALTYVDFAGVNSN
jgi:hypothetical protein